MDQPPIPPRSSSKSPTKGPSSSPTKRLRDLEDERRTINDMAKKARKRLKVAMSFDVQYWSTRHEVTEHELKATRLTKKISMAKMNTPAEEFFKSKEGRKLLLEESSLELDDKLYLSQAKAMDNPSRTFNLRRSFVGLFIGAETGLNLQNNLGQRDDSLQSKFRKDLEVRMLSEHEDPDRTTLWCPITGQYWPRAATQAGHLFPYKSGQVYMDAIFGYIRDKDGMSELFKAENGILWSSETETRFSAGHFVIIPNVADDPTSQELIDWEHSDPKQYKIRVLNPDDSTMKKKIQDTEVKWYQLNDQPVRFKGNFRPRARYLYFCYCTAMLRRALTGQQLEVSRSELRKRFWGTPGKYMRKSMLLGFVEQMGHDYDHLLEGAIHEDDAEAEFEGIAVANDHIKDTLKDPDEGDESEDDDDDECYLLSNVWFILARRPDIWEKLQAEVSQLRGELPTFAQIKEMKYLKQVLNEALRLHPVVPGNSRMAVRDTVLPVGGGEDGKSPLFVPAKTVVVWSVYSMHRRIDFYGEDADEFKPERWDDLRPGWEYLPFNGGPRICIGQQFALTEASYTTIRLMQEFKKIESRDEGPWEESLTSTCVKRNGTNVGLRPE